MSDEALKDIEEVLVMLLRQIHEVRTDHDALMQIVTETYSATDGLAFLKKYEARKKQISESVLLKLEEQFPSLAARLDELRPLLPPDDGMKK